MKKKRVYEVSHVYFFTVIAKNRKADLFMRNAELMDKVLKQAGQHYLFKIIAYVYLPDHIHCLLRFRNGQPNYSQMWANIKKHFTLLYKQKYCLNDKIRLFQRHFWGAVVKDELDLENKINYIHDNPVKHGYTLQAMNWKHSSYKQYFDTSHVKVGL